MKSRVLIGATSKSLYSVCAWIDVNVTESFVIVSDDLQHGKYAVHTFLSNIITTLISRHPRIRAIDFFSDGTANLFKQKFLFSNLTFLQELFNIHLSWNLFATSHGKGAVDGIWGEVKRRVWLANLAGDPISDAESFFRVAAAQCKKIEVLFMAAGDIQKCQSQLDERWQ